MTKYIYHPGTGTLIDLNDGCVVIDDEALGLDPLDTDDSVALDEIARQHGRRFIPDDRADNSLIVSLTPRDIQIELAESYALEEALTAEVLDWVEVADVDTLRRIGNIAVNDETFSLAITETLAHAITEVYEHEYVPEDDEQFPTDDDDEPVRVNASGQRLRDDATPLPGDHDE